MVGVRRGTGVTKTGSDGVRGLETIVKGEDEGTDAPYRYGRRTTRKRHIRQVGLWTKDENDYRVE